MKQPQTITEPSLLQWKLHFNYLKFKTIFLKIIEKVNVSEQSGDDGVSLHNNPIELHSLQQKAHSEFSLPYHNGDPMSSAAGFRTKRVISVYFLVTILSRCG